MFLPITMPITLFQPAIIKIIALNNGQELLVMIIEEEDASIIMRYESETLLGGSTMRAFFRANLHISLYNDTRQGWLVGLILKNCPIISFVLPGLAVLLELPGLIPLHILI